MHRKPEDPREGLSRLFGDDVAREDVRVSALGDTPFGVDPSSRVRASVVRLRRVRSQVGAEGLTPAATRTLLDEVIQALEAVEEGLAAAHRPVPGGDE
ncbi:MAG: hypothetical protein WD056_02680 [Gemmatimonadota bacterium]